MSRAMNTPSIKKLFKKKNKQTHVLTPTFFSNSPTMLRAEILADVASGVPERPSPTKTTAVTERPRGIKAQKV